MRRKRKRKTDIPAGWLERPEMWLVAYRRLRAELQFIRDTDVKGAWHREFCGDRLVWGHQPGRWSEIAGRALDGTPPI